MAQHERRKQVIVALVILGIVALSLLGMAAAAHLPGLAGEFFARVLGLLTTPFILETSFFILGFVIVLTLNQWRQMREGDELVYLEQVQDAPAGLPDQARWAIYPNKPLEPGTVAEADLLEGALAIGDHGQAIAILDGMSSAERERPEVLRSRIALAEATGKSDLARDLREKLGKTSC
ncbi:hypothetical protein [Haloferula sp. BvORR071]|uniref:hypothetical protein n=1 Tax=Haloferula sp. BvORR071 TaxID=1396141 RepID=UPI0005535620|nr:hypothetical protein [Haloferula sp. BvORR071]